MRGTTAACAPYGQKEENDALAENSCARTETLAREWGISCGWLYEPTTSISTVTPRWWSASSWATRTRSPTSTSATSAASAATASAASVTAAELRGYRVLLATEELVVTLGAYLTAA